MYKKIILILLLIIGIIYLFLTNSNTQRIENILRETLNINKQIIKNMKKIDEITPSLLKTSIEKYAYKISQLSLLNCKLFTNFLKQNYISEFGKKYIDINKEYCHYTTIDKDERTIEFYLQKNIFILEVYID